ncbi:SDR family NAD(P)-dependent oxidoreductase [Rhodococcus sp. LB1]|uniref:SDR family NAD(P)-dependent oxidoreductase n=1 Tax=Rhodococcus sp. LB1 TaxID=1807499 RepID=UPI000B08E272|nr:SDR family NAD(P)-dependent oxidoreductase [Rhodococcus sp. LB1]
MEINFFAPLLVARAFAPILSAAENAVLIDMHSVASWYAAGGPYSASKAALWSATNSLRLELAPHGVLVTGVHVGYVDTAMAAHTDDPKMKPADLVTAVFNGVESDAFEVVPPPGARGALNSKRPPWMASISSSTNNPSGPPGCCRSSCAAARNSEDVEFRVPFSRARPEPRPGGAGDVPARLPD